MEQKVGLRANVLDIKGPQIETSITYDETIEGSGNCVDLGHITKIW
jgi:hypothetical protein